MREAREAGLSEDATNELVMEAARG
jgi:hypothetical protein